MVAYWKYCEERNERTRTWKEGSEKDRGWVGIDMREVGEEEVGRDVDELFSIDLGEGRKE